MAVSSAVAVWLAKAAASYAIRNAAGRGIDGLKSEIVRMAKSQGNSLSTQDLKTLDGLLSGSNEFFQAIFAATVPYSYSGMICVGPSGSGKTSIQNFFAEDRLTGSSASTLLANVQHTRYGTWSYYMTDTPGQHQFAESREGTANAITDQRSKVLMLVLAGGYLKTVGMLDADGSEIKLKRPSQNASATLHAYLDQSIDEEIDWLETLVKKLPALKAKQRYKYLMVVVNKLDQWYGVRDRVVSFYTGLASPKSPPSLPPLAQHLTAARSKRLRAALAIIASGWCIQSIKPSFHAVSAQYDSFYDNPPSGEMSQAASEQSLRLLRAQVRLRFIEA